jgi:branched-chain amino acid transport system permease protein
VRFAGVENSTSIASIVAILDSGIIITSSVLLMALGLSLIFGVLQVVNFAHGSLFTLGTFIAYFICVKFGMNFLVALALAVVVGFLIGLILEKTIFFPLRKDVLSGVIAAFGLSFIIQVSLGQIFGLDIKGVPPVVRRDFHFGPFHIDAQRLFILGFAALLATALIIFIHRSRFGRAIRALAQNSELSLLMGIKTSFIRFLTFGISVALATSAGVLMSPVTYIDPYVGGELLIEAFAAIIVGGLGSIYGSIVGSIVVGFLMAVGLFFFSTWAFAILFGAIVVVLVVRPQGIIPFEG